MPLFIEQAKTGEVTITDERMTRFMISLEQGVELVWHAFDDMAMIGITVSGEPVFQIIIITTPINKENPMFSRILRGRFPSVVLIIFACAATRADAS
ncbi:polysaccharide biosynthesis protein [Treponema sp. R80B11-R83G3]